MKKLLILALLAAVLLAGCAAQPVTFYTDGVEVCVDVEQGTITDGIHTYKYTIDGEQIALDYPNGQRLTGELGRYIDSEALEQQGYLSAYTLKGAAQHAAELTDRQPNGGLIFGGLVILLTALVDVIWPGFWRQMRLYWQVKDATPTEEAKTWDRYFGIAGLVLGAMFLIGGIIGI